LQHKNKKSTVAIVIDGEKIGIVKCFASKGGRDFEKEMGANFPFDIG